MLDDFRRREGRRSRPSALRRAPGDGARPAAEQSQVGSVANIVTTRVSILLSLPSRPRGLSFTYKPNTYFPVSTTQFPRKELEAGGLWAQS